MDKIYEKSCREIQGVNTTIFSRILDKGSEEAFRSFHEEQGHYLGASKIKQGIWWYDSLKEFHPDFVKGARYITNIVQTKDAEEPHIIHLSYTEHWLVVRVTEIVPNMVTKRSFFKSRRTPFQCGVNVTKYCLEWKTENRSELTTSVDIVIGSNNPIRIEE